MAVILVVPGAVSLQKNHRFHTGVMRCDNGAGEIGDARGHRLSYLVVMAAMVMFFGWDVFGRAQDCSSTQLSCWYGCRVIT